MEDVVLSRFFDANVRLVAGVCARCYLDGDDDVRIVAVNRKFLQQVAARKREDRSARRTAITAGQAESPRLNCGRDAEETAAASCSGGILREANPDPDHPENSAALIKVEETGNRIQVVNLAKLKCEPRSSTWFAPKTEPLWNWDAKPEVVKPAVNLAKLKAEPKPHKPHPECLWMPPRSPHNLIEESLFHDPWALLVATIFLNKTSCMCARPRVEQFLQDHPGPQAVLEKRPSELEKYFADLGLFRRRAEQVWRMSRDFLHKNWRRPKELYGIGKYGDDAYSIFVLGDLEVEPADRFLRIYRDWAKMKRADEKGTTLVDDYQ